MTPTSSRVAVASSTGSYSPIKGSSGTPTLQTVAAGSATERETRIGAAGFLHSSFSLSSGGSSIQRGATAPTDGTESLAEEVTDEDGEAAAAAAVGVRAGVLEMIHPRRIPERNLIKGSKDGGLDSGPGWPEEQPLHT